MAFQYLTNIPLDEAKATWLGALTARGMAPKAEWVPVSRAFGRVTAEAVYAHICAPHYHACAMDGVALNAAVTFGATETTPVLLTPDRFTRVDTGDPLPANCDAVVMIADVIEEEGGSIRLFSAAAPWQHIRQIGEDICAGDMILPSFTEITPAAAGAMLAGGVLEVKVVKKPLVGIIPTGDEIVPPSADPGEGDIIEFNSSIFSGMIESRGGAVKVYPIVKDKLELIKAALQAALTECDAVLLNAGSSAGREDFSTQAIRETGEVVLHGIAIRPGKPAILGMSGKTPILGVPGYPVSGIIVLEQLFLPVLDALCGRAQAEEALTSCTISQRLVSSLKYREFVRARVGCVDGRMIAVPLNRGAGVVSSFVKADGIIDVPQDLEGYEAGDPVRVRLLRSRREIENTLVITGSHDPLIDEAADILKRAHYDSAVASSHVGSMGGILALKRREAHMGGIHLLDTETGVYNDSYIARYLPAGAVEKIPCVRRVQGLMVQKGNPKGIRAFSDIARISYVNRQKGSGTRILCDHLAHEAGLDTSAVYGYEREEFTHTAVAALIAAGSADAGLGIYSAAKLYDLDFIPICDEVYDLIVLKDAMNLTQVQRFLETISGPALRARLEKLGGYAWN